MMTSYPTPSGLRAPRPAAMRAEPGVKRLLILDDEETIRLALGKFMRTRGYEVHTAETGAEALDLLARYRFSLMLCDVRMPGLSGTEVLPRALQADPDLAVMMLSAVNDAPTATEAMSRGAMDYLIKPVELAELELAAERALHRRELTMEQRRVEQVVRDEVALRTAELEREKQALRTMTVRVAATLVNAMEAKDVYLRGHSQRVADLAASMAEELGLDEDEVEDVRMAGRLADVGKIGTRESVLNKPGSLTPEEFEHVKDHVRVSMEILAPLRHIERVLRFVEDHHEHWSGAGYPNGRAGREISVGGRILAAADAFNALTSKRAYRDPMTPDEVIDYLGAKHVGKLLDPDVFEALRTVVTGNKSVALSFIE